MANKRPRNKSPLTRTILASLNFCSLSVAIVVESQQGCPLVQSSEYPQRAESIKCLSRLRLRAINRNTSAFPR